MPFPPNGDKHVTPPPPPNVELVVMVGRWLALKNKYQNTSRQRRQILLRRLDNSVIRSIIEPDVFLFDVFQIRDELNDLGEAVTDKRSTTIILDTLPKEMYRYSTVKMQSIRDPDLELEEIIGMVKTIFINHFSSPKESRVVP